jgi:Reductase C-terminal
LRRRFFWSQHYDIPINYVGHAERWDEIALEGDIAAKDCLVRYKRGGRTVAVASIFRDAQSLEAEVNFERRRELHSSVCNGHSTSSALKTRCWCTLGQINYSRFWGQRGIFPKEHAKGVSAIGHGFPLPKPLIFSFGGLGGRLAEQVARDVDQREPPPFFGQFGGVGLDEYLDGLVAGINFDTQRAALEIDFVTPSRFTANNCMGHLRSYERLKG